MSAGPKQARQLSAGSYQLRTYNDKSFRIPELKAALSRIIAVEGFDDHRFCFLIESLDEFEANTETDQGDSAVLLQSWARCPDVKICASSGPPEEFLQKFNSYLRVHLHKLTREDIYCYTDDQLSLS